jgi:hypothetical protein
LCTLIGAAAVAAEPGSGAGASSRPGLDTFDIANLTLEMSPVQIQDTLRKNGVRAFNELNEQLTFHDEINSAMVPVPNWTFKGALWATDGTGSFRIFYSPEPGRERAVQIRYTVALDPQARIAEATFLQSVTAKFGPPTVIATPAMGATNPKTPPPGTGVLFWNSGPRQHTVGQSSPCYQFATEYRNELDRYSMRFNNPVFDVLRIGPPQTGNVLETCGNRYLLIEFFAVSPGDPLMLHSSAATRLVTGYSLVLVDVKASVDSVVPALDAAQAAKTASARSTYGKAQQAAPQL